MANMRAPILKSRALRLPENLDRRLVARAAAESRSVNATIVLAVDQYLEGRARPPRDPVAPRLDGRNVVNPRFK